MLIGLLLSAPAVRVYRVEYLLGLVLGMALAFGALLPTVIGGGIAPVSAAAGLGVGPLPGRAITKARA